LEEGYKMLRKTKIVCTLGPQTSSKDMLEKLINAGMNVVRLNTSHGTIEEHRKMIKLLKSLRESLNISLPIILDLEGPKVRIVGIENEIDVKKGEELSIYASSEQIHDKGFATTCGEKVLEYLNIDDVILIDDGNIKLKVLNKLKDRLKCVALNSGKLRSKKGLSVPGIDFDLPPLSEKDRDFVALAVEENIEFIAQSYVRKAVDVLELKRILHELNSDIDVIAKIETPQALKNLDDIVRVSDGILVARGDLGVELPIERVAIEQKRIIQLANLYSKPVITATQMLESMISKPTPTRAEVADITNSILDGTDAIMLSGETAIGYYPIESVQVMDKVARVTEERYEEFKRNFLDTLREYPLIKDTNEAIAKACWEISNDLDLNVIVTPTTSGSTSRRVSKYRPKALIVGITPEFSTYQKLGLVWGVYPILVGKTTNTDEMLDAIEELILTLGLARKGEQIIITAGIPWGLPGTTNLLKIQTLSEAV
jgi:pyruvate kinase